MRYNISKFLIIFIFLIFSKDGIVNAKTDEETFLGNKDAKIIVIEYASMTCAHCASFHEKVYPKIKKNYIDTNKIKYVFRDFPLDKQALFASVLAKCAPKDKYFDFVKLILANQKKWVSNDDAFIYANQSSSDGTYLVNELRDNTVTDKFVWWFNNYVGRTTDSFPLMLEGNKAVINYYYDRRTTFHRDNNATNGAANNVDFY